ncbi:MAG: hypothetical protein R8J41_11025 [Alphaproteobacteria bacterium]|nr:hypothetical protein [Alphaproteobacteria bacterium]
MKSRTDTDEGNSRALIGAVHTRAKALEAHILEHSRGAEAGETVAGGYAARGSAKPENSSKDGAKRKSNEMMQAVLDSTAEMQRQLDRLYEQREALYDQLSDVEFKIDKLDQTVQRMNDGDMPEIGSDGKLIDADFEAMIAAEEKRLGRSIDRSDPKALMAIFAAEHQRSINERDETLEAIDKNEAEIKAVREGRDLDEKPNSYLDASNAIEKANAIDSTAASNPTYESEFDQFGF